MSTHIHTIPHTPVFQAATRASFPGMMRGEMRKVMRLCWLMLALMLVGFLGYFFLGANLSGLKADLQHTPLHFLYYSLESNMVAIRILGGIFLLVLTSFVIGREYQYGTIRILLARGAGRVQLLLAKLALLALVALSLVALFMVLILLLTCLQMLILVGNLDAFRALTPTFWSNAGLDLLAVLISLGATILLAAAMNALGRSLTFGLSASLIWFPLDNIGSPLLNLLAHLTHSNFWLSVSSYLLGPLLNRLPDMLLPAADRSGFASFGTEPLVAVSSTHALLVISVYVLLFIVLAFIPTWKRDVRE